MRRILLLSLAVITILLMTSCKPLVLQGELSKNDFDSSLISISQSDQAEAESDNIPITENSSQEESSASPSTSATVHQHTFGSWRVVTEAKCGESGKRVRSCECGYEEVQILPALKHSWGEWSVLTPATHETTGEQRHTCSACGATESQIIPVKVLTDADKKAQARVVAQQIADEALKNGTTDLEKIQYAATAVAGYCMNATYTTDDKDYSQAYGVFIKGVYTCAGSTRALGLVLECMGYDWSHANENQWTHQWCIVKMDGQEGFADGQVGLAGYGKHPVAE